MVGRVKGLVESATGRAFYLGQIGGCTGYGQKSGMTTCAATGKYYPFPDIMERLDFQAIVRAIFSAQPALP
ncbi:MAG: hypothetical protein Alpg2KO_26330 [Alphaproteobacteria bacterium]